MPKDPKSYRKIVEHYEACLEKHGDSHRGVDWPNAQDALTRYQVMLDVIRPDDLRRGATLLDFGCGLSHLKAHILDRGIAGITYSGLDLSDRFVSAARAKYPDSTYYCLDILDPGAKLPRFDYVVANGVFTEKRELSQAEMMGYLRKTLRRLFDHCERGLAFNVMSKHVDWERDDLFHVPLDEMGRLLVADLSRHFVVRHDYGLYEYTVYVYKDPGKSP